MGKLNLEEKGRNCRIIVPKEAIYAHYGTEALSSFASRNTSLWRQNDVFRDEKRVIAPHTLSRKNYNFDFMQLFPCSFDNTFIVLAFKIALILTIYGHVGENLISFISCNFTPFYPIEMGFSLHIFFLCSKNVCNVLNIALQVFNVVTKNRHHLRRHSFKKRQKYLYNGKNLKKNFL